MSGVGCCACVRRVSSETRPDLAHLLVDDLRGLLRVRPLRRELAVGGRRVRAVAHLLGHAEVGDDVVRQSRHLLEVVLRRGGGGGR